MKIPKTIAHKAQSIRSDLGKTVGRLTGNRRLQARSRRDQAKIGIKQAGAKVKEALWH